MPRRILLVGVTALLALVVLLVPRLSSAQQNVICFNTVPNVTNCIGGRFAQFWQQNGGLELFGFPITGEYVEVVDGTPRTVQYFERARFEYHPENALPFDVQLGRLGVTRLQQQGRDWQSVPRVSGPPAPECFFSQATGHSICGEFLAYFRSRGVEYDGVAGSSEGESIALFGLPISEPQVEPNANGVPVVTQWFERARFELQPENPPGFRVLLGLVGSETYLALQAATPPPPPASPPPLPPRVTPIPPTGDDGGDSSDDDDDEEKFISREGPIASLDTARNTFTITSGGRVWTVRYGSYTNILRRDGSPASEADLAVGLNVFVRGADKGNLTIRVRTLILP